MNKDKKSKKRKDKKIEKLKKAYLNARAKKKKLKERLKAYREAVRDCSEKRKKYYDAIGKGKKKVKKKKKGKKKKDETKKATAPKVELYTPDDLKVIEGIGPKIEELLNNADIYTWKTLAKSKVEDLKQLLIDFNPRYRIHNPTYWPQQAKLAAEGKWEELKVLQD